MTDLRRRSPAITAAIAGLERMASLLPIVVEFRAGRLGEAEALQRMKDAGADEAEARVILNDPRLLLTDRVH